jgi:hypothetical protein
MPTHTQLKGVRGVHESLLSKQLEANLTTFFQWGFLGVGGFFSARMGQPNCFNIDETRLRPVSDPRYPDGQVWQGFRKDWVWETGVEFDQQPIRVSGVWVNGTFRASGHFVDYPNGQVHFHPPVSPTSIVQCEHSYRLFQVYTSNNEGWRRLQKDSFRSDDPHFTQTGSGVWDIPGEYRLQLPAVVVDVVPNVTSRKGYELGSQVQIVEQEVHFHILAEDPDTYRWLHDAITNQVGKRLVGFDVNQMFARDAFPLDWNGTPKPSGMMYPDLIKPSGEGGFEWRQIRIQHARSYERAGLGGIRYCQVNLRIEVDIP